MQPSFVNRLSAVVIFFVFFFLISTMLIQKVSQIGVADRPVLESVFLPPFITDGMLLTYVYAQAGPNAENSLALIRISDLVDFPREFKSNLKGCFLIGEATGDAKLRRAMIKITDLSCLSKDKRETVNEKITGFVTDLEGNMGVEGAVSDVMKSKVEGMFKNISGVDPLKKYYMGKLDKMVSVIKVASGTKITVVSTNGITVKINR